MHELGTIRANRKVATTEDNIILWQIGVALEDSKDEQSVITKGSLIKVKALTELECGGGNK